ncbi:hypothetical protein AX17_003744, partial [Amanita inopinata Kibby_2008]
AMGVTAGEQCRCLVRGSINNDEYFYVQSISRPGETISSTGYKRRIGGKGANQAVAIARAGGSVVFYGTIGKDGSWLKDEMKSYGLDVTGIVATGEITGRALIQVAENGENSIVLFPGANYSQLHEERFKDESDNHHFPNATHLLLQNEIHMRSSHFALQHAGSAITILNPSPLPSLSEIKEFPWQRIHWLIVNEGEAEDLYRSIVGQAVQRWSRREELLQLLSALPPLRLTNIICTLGAQGVVAVIPPPDKASEGTSVPSLIHVPATELQNGVCDTTGAGDCFTGYFVRQLMKFGPGAKVGQEISKEGLRNILKVSVQAAGISVERPGTIDSIPFMDEVDARMATNQVQMDDFAL